MNLYTTYIYALVDGEITQFSGPKVPGISFADAQDYCESNSLGYCVVDMVFTGEFDVKETNKNINYRDN